MRDRGGNDFEIDDEDVEAAADLALGITPEDTEENSRRLRMKRLQRVGAKLTARSFLSDRRKRQFIRTLAQTGIVSRAAAAAGWTSNTAYSIRAANKDFATMWDNAMEFSTDALEEEARRRGQFGVKKPVYQQGKLVGYEQQYSDPLLIMLLKAHRKDVFGDQQKVSHDHKGGVLVVPGIASEDAWEKAAAGNQATHRANTGDDSNGDPLA